jgi:hypothetical protein
MNEKDQKKKSYPAQEFSSSVVCEPEVTYKSSKINLPSISNEMSPKGFVTGEEFRKRVKENIYNFYKENGLL